MPVIVANRLHLPLLVCALLATAVAQTQNGTDTTDPDVATFNARYNNAEHYKFMLPVAVLIGYSAVLLNVVFVAAILRNKSLQNISNYMLIGSCLLLLLC